MSELRSLTGSAMRALLLRMFLTGLLCLLASQAAEPLRAQEFRVYTAVNMVGEAPGSRQVVARSLTLFQAGRVFDHMEDVGELVIFEPVQNRFLLIRDTIATEVSLDELKKMLDVATDSAGRYVQDLERTNSPEALILRDQLQFQLHPKFETSFDPGSRRLTMRGSEQSYVVETSNSAPPEIVTAYLRYADWMARLNTVLHSRGSFSAPREMLNRELGTQNLLPVSVTMQTRQVRLEARHEYRWQLQSIDRDQIHHWERLKDSRDLRWVSFREYQQRLLASAKKASR